VYQTPYQFFYWKFINLWKVERCTEEVEISLKIKACGGHEF
jgi:hypothetical protein